MELFCEIIEWGLFVNYFQKKTSFQKLDWALNMPLILSKMIMLLDVLISLWQKPRVSNFVYPSYTLQMLKKINDIIRNYMTEDKFICFRYPEFSSIFTINKHTFENLIQINIKFTFIAYEYMICQTIFMFFFKIVAAHTHTGHTSFPFS